MIPVDSNACNLEFGVKHFAGDVLYNVESFLEKNKDALATGLVKLINQSSIGFIHTPDAEAERNASTASMPASPTGLASSFYIESMDLNLFVRM